MPTGTDTLLLEMFAIFVWAKVFAEIFEQLYLPAVLGEILAGVILGPYATGLVAPSDTIASIAEIGAIFLLFTVGLETRPHDLIGVGRQSLLVALAGVVAPFVLGFLYMATRGQPTHESIFVAAAMVATSVGITARVLSDLHLLGTRVAKIILGAAVFDDILGMIILAIVAVAATQIGMAAIIGAFFAGLVFADYSPEWNLQPRAHAINEFLAPFFFFTMGARLNLHVFHREIVVAAVVISLLAIVSKVLACGLPILHEGFRAAIRVGVGMTPRGEVALIVALIGLQTKMISQGAYAIVIFMTATTTMLAPPLMRLLFRDEIPVPEEQEAELEAEQTRHPWLP
jgi:Kef-type K+ transport system membrane component KefB